MFKLTSVSMNHFLPWISILLFLAVTSEAYSQSPMPGIEIEEEKLVFSALIESNRGYVSGICVILVDEVGVRGRMFNEFGFTLLDFSIGKTRDKAQINEIAGILGRKTFKRLLRGDLPMLMEALNKGETEYLNRRKGLRYQFKPLENAA